MLTIDEVNESELNLEIFSCEYEIDIVIIDNGSVKSFERIVVYLPITIKALGIYQNYAFQSFDDYLKNGEVLTNVSIIIRIPFGCKLFDLIEEYKIWRFLGTRINGTRKNRKLIQQKYNDLKYKCSIKYTMLLNKYELVYNNKTY